MQPCGHWQLTHRNSKNIWPVSSQLHACNTRKHRQNFPTKQGDTILERNRQHFHGHTRKHRKTKLSNKTYITLLGNRQNFPSRTKTRWVGDISLMPWTGEYWGPAEPPPQPRQASHRTEPDYDSLEDHCRCLLKFSAWPFTLIVHKMNKLGHLKAHASWSGLPTLEFQSEGRVSEFGWVVWILLWTSRKC